MENWTFRVRRNQRKGPFNHVIHTLYATYSSQLCMQTELSALIGAFCGVFSDPLFIIESELFFHKMKPVFALVEGNPTVNIRKGAANLHLPSAHHKAP